MGFYCTGGQLVVNYQESAVLNGAESYIYWPHFP
jgi:hypothetical protein